MKVTLKLCFSTQPGQQLCVTGNHPILGNDEADRAAELEYLNRDFWQVTLSFPPEDTPRTKGISYRYLLRQPDGSTISDWAGDRVLSPEWLNSNTDLLIVDSWNAPGFPQNAFDTEPFRSILLRGSQTRFCRPTPAHSTHTFRIKAPLLRRGETLALLGSSDLLGNWDTAKPVLLNRNPGDNWLTVSLDLRGATLPMEYKYGVFDTERNTFLRYEGGNNRCVDESSDGSRQVLLNDGFVVLPVNTWKGAGVAIPVFSLRSATSFGVGEFADLKRLADWCQQVGLKLIQILPVNDTTATGTWVDSYPYAAISAFALHPIYLNLDQVATGRNQRLLRELEPEKARLNQLAQLDYEAVMQVKLGFLRRIFPTQQAATFRSKAFRHFFASNRHWLEPYAAFCCLRDRYGTPDTSQWRTHRQCTPEEMAAMAAPDSPDYSEMALHYFIQFHLHTQLLDAVDHLHACGVVLKGDIAIGVARHGADTWQQPHLYDLNMQAGAPPDPFAEKGQNWGFPTYNWPAMKRDGFAWWKRRFEQMGVYFDAFRIDHILGFFRIWSIPMHAVEGILGRFVPALPVAPRELLARGITIEASRLVEPFITEGILRNLFGVEADSVRQTFLQPASADCYVFRSRYTTQRQVEEHFAQLEATPRNQKLKAGLFDLLSNVILLQVRGEPGLEYHLRFHAERTESFRQLDRESQEKLHDLYIDYFFRRQEGFWRENSMQKLPALKAATEMLVCGEDLGVVPACVPEVMQNLGLLGLEIQRMPKSLGVTFSRPSAAPYLSVVTPSTHDMSTIRGWWAEDAAVTQRFYTEELGLPGQAPAACSTALTEAVVKQHLASPAMWSIFQLQDLLGLDEAMRHPQPESERINVPAIPKHYWRYRMHLTLEALAQAKAFNQRLRSLIEQHDR